MNWLEEKENNGKFWNVTEEYKINGITVRCIEWPKDRPICIFRADELEKCKNGTMRIPTNIIVPGFNIKKYDYSINHMVNSVVERDGTTITHIGVFKIKDKADYYGIVGIPSDFVIVEDFFSDLFLYGAREKEFKC